MIDYPGSPLVMTDGSTIEEFIANIGRILAARRRLGPGRDETPKNVSPSAGVVHQWTITVVNWLKWIMEQGLIILKPDCCSCLNYLAQLSLLGLWQFTAWYFRYCFQQNPRGKSGPVGQLLEKRCWTPEAGDFPISSQHFLKILRKPKHFHPKIFWRYFIPANSSKIRKDNRDISEDH